MESKGLRKRHERPILRPTIHKKQPRETRGARVLRLTRKFTSKFSLHCWSYVFLPDRPWFERLWWTVIMSTVYSLVFTIVGYQVRLYLNDEPIIVNDVECQPVSRVPFPAITLCPDNQIRPSFFQFGKALRNQTELQDVDQEIFDYAVFLCQYTLNESMRRKYFTDEFVKNIMQKVYSFDKCQEQVENMMWQGRLVKEPCSLMQPMVTPKGACFSFNMLPLSQVFRYPSDILGEVWGSELFNAAWTPDEGFSQDIRDTKALPRRVASASSSSSVQFQIDLLKHDFDGACSRGGNGLWVYVHNPAEMPSDHHFVNYLEPDQITTIRVYPQLVTTNVDMMSWDPEQRNCIFNSDRQLAFFKIYSQRHCELECESNITLWSCGCLPFYHPRLNDTPVCGPGKMSCIMKAMSATGDVPDIQYKKCNCLPACSELQYRVSLYSLNRNLTMMGFNLRRSNSTYTSIIVQFQDTYFTALFRTYEMGFIDFVANIGGLVSLFTGFSILSSVELFRFLTFELIFPPPIERKRRRT